MRQFTVFTLNILLIAALFLAYLTYDIGPTLLYATTSIIEAAIIIDLVLPGYGEKKSA